eukprot:Skav215653  [mRNA]  locus=scaffold1588:233434:238522:+ [translate_table: standard]
MVRFLLYDRHKQLQEQCPAPSLLGPLRDLLEEKVQKATSERREEKIREENWRSAMKESLQMVKRSNRFEEDPLTVAVERGLSHSLTLEHYMPWCRGPGRVQAFKKVALSCPDAAPKLVRTYPRPGANAW